MNPKHITNITYQNFYDIYYYITFPNIKPFLYGISIYGDIISLVQNREKKRKLDYDKQGYPRIKLRTIDSNTKSFLVSRLVAWEFVGQPENYNNLEVNHVDGIHIHNYYKNLEWVTNEENLIHKVRYGLTAKEERHGCNKHKKKVAKDIILMIDNNISAPEIALTIINRYPKLYNKNKKDYDRLRGLVSKIKHNNSWYKLKNKIEGSTTIENITYEKHIGEEVSRVGLKPIPVRKNGQLIFVKRK